jgi:hypothetical protein
LFVSTKEIKMKTDELTGAALDWAVAKCEDQPVYWNEEDEAVYCGDGIPNYLGYRGDTSYTPSIDWAQGGPIIERERIEVRPYDGIKWIATDNLTNHTVGKTPLIAAMRCFVASKLGDDIEIPEGLK